MSAPAPVRGATSEGAAVQTLARAKAAYRAAIDAGALDREGAAWWDELVAEVQPVVAAPDTRSAAALIAWWHADWRAIGDTPARAQRDVDGDRRGRTAAPEAAA